MHFSSLLPITLTPTPHPSTPTPCSTPLPGEDPSFEYPASLAPPLQILLDASNGASDYGNKFGEPMVAGYTRTFGQRLPSGERREWIKPIMFRWVGWVAWGGVWVGGVSGMGLCQGNSSLGAMDCNVMQSDAWLGGRVRQPPGMDVSLHAQALGTTPWALLHSTATHADIRTHSLALPNKPRPLLHPPIFAAPAWAKSTTPT